MPLIFLSGCAWFGKNEHESITGNYEAGWNDLVRNRNISKSIKNCSGCYEIVVDGYVYAVGHNDSYIIAKQHLNGDTTVTYYYVIDTKQNEKSGAKEGIYTLGNQNTFDSLRKRLGISHIPFDVNYPEYP